MKRKHVPVRVRTLSPLHEDQYTDKARLNRKWNVEGIIINFHDSHGLCYEVRHDDGTEGCYDPDELEFSDGMLKSCVDQLNSMSKNERSLLLFFETCAVDHRGRIDGRRMNEEDRAIAERWNDNGYISYGRIRSDFLDNPQHFTNWVQFSEQAWRDAHCERRRRYERNIEKRTWKKSSE